MQIETLSAALSILSSMVTPAVLILASSSLIVATSNRLGRAIDRTRAVSERIVELAAEDPERTMLGEERALLLEQLGRVAKRTRLLTHAMMRLYVALAIFLGTSVAIGIVAVAGSPYAWVPLVLGLAGAALLFDVSLLLIREARIGLLSVQDEMDFVQELGSHYAPPSNLVERRRWIRRRR